MSQFYNMVNGFTIRLYMSLGPCDLICSDGKWMIYEMKGLK